MRDHKTYMKLKNKLSERSLAEKAAYSRKQRPITSAAKRESQLYGHTGEERKDFTGTGQWGPRS